MNTSGANIQSQDYHALAEFRYQIRKFMHFSEKMARDVSIKNLMLLPDKTGHAKLSQSSILNREPVNNQAY